MNSPFYHQSPTISYHCYAAASPKKNRRGTSDVTFRPCVDRCRARVVLPETEGPMTRACKRSWRKAPGNAGENCWVRREKKSFSENGWKMDERETFGGLTDSIWFTIIYVIYVIYVYSFPRLNQSDCAGSWGKTKSDGSLRQFPGSFLLTDFYHVCVMTCLLGEWQISWSTLQKWIGYINFLS